MWWFRANKTFGCRLALFALALQFVLSFDHIHPQDIYGPVNVAVDAPIALAAVDHSRIFSIDHRARHADDFCDICATTALLANSFVPEPPQLPPPAGFRAVEQVDRVAALFVAPRRAPFQSRAPPAA